MQDTASKCKAWQFSSNGVITDSLAIKHIPIPSAPSRWSSFLSSLLRSYGPHPGVLIRVAAASLNPVDYKMIQPGSPAFLVRKPCIPGSDFSGVVVCALNGGNKQLEAVGLAPGMRVYGYMVTEWRMLLVCHESHGDSKLFRVLMAHITGHWNNGRVHCSPSTSYFADASHIVLRTGFLRVPRRHEQLASPHRSREINVRSEGLHQWW